MLCERTPQVCKPDCGSTWSRLAKIPVPYHTSLTTLRGQVLTIGGRGQGVNMYCYDRSTNSWSVIGETPTPRTDPLVAVLPYNELIVMGGLNRDKQYCDNNEIASFATQTQCT